MVRASMRKKIVVLYLPSEADVKRWQALARSKSSSLSSWVFETVENSLNRPPSKPVADTEEVNRLRRENSDLKLEIEQIKRLNTDLRLAKASQAFLSTVQTLEQKIKATMQNGAVWSGEKLVNKLKLDLTLGQEDLQSLNKLLRRLIDENKIEEVVGGFRWKAKH